MGWVFMCLVFVGSNLEFVLGFVVWDIYLNNKSSVVINRWYWDEIREFSGFCKGIEKVIWVFYVGELE